MYLYTDSNLLGRDQPAEWSHTYCTWQLKSELCERTILLWHVLIATAAAKYLKAHEAELRGTVKLLFQPAEEGGAGAKVMIDEGALQGVSAVFGLHVWPTAPSGHIQTRVCPSPVASNAPHHLQTSAKHSLLQHLHAYKQ